MTFFCFRLFSNILPIIEKIIELNFKSISAEIIILINFNVYNLEIGSYS